MYINKKYLQIIISVVGLESKILLLPHFGALLVNMKAHLTGSYLRGDLGMYFPWKG